MGSVCKNFTRKATCEIGTHPWGPGKVRDGHCAKTRVEERGDVRWRPQNHCVLQRRFTGQRVFETRTVSPRNTPASVACEVHAQLLAGERTQGSVTTPPAAPALASFCVLELQSGFGPRDRMPPSTLCFLLVCVGHLCSCEFVWKSFPRAEVGPLTCLL